MAAEDHLKRAKEEFEATRKAIGIEPHFRPLATVYNPASGCIVASVERHTADFFERRLFFRHSSERTYRPIASPSLEIHYADVVSSLSRPTIY